MFLAARKCLIRFVREKDGATAILFGLVALPLLGLVGAAVDYARAASARTELQSAIDAATLAGAIDGSATWTNTALAMFNANLGAAGSDVAPPSFSATDLSYSGSVSASVSTTFMALYGRESVGISASSKVLQVLTPETSCLLTLDHGNPASHVSITFNGAPNINLSGCTVRSNTSLVCHGHGGGMTASIAAGTSNGCSNPQPDAKVMPDIHASLAANISTQCAGSAPGATWTPGTPPPGMITVNKGAYDEYHICGTLTVSGSGFLTGHAPASDSVIVIENGGLRIANNSSISTMRTAIVLTGDNSRPSAITFPNGNGQGSTLSLSPPTGAGNPWRGVSLYQNPALTNGVDHNWGPGATFNADGVVYLPNSDLVMRGNGASNISQCTKIVTNSFRTNGAVDLNFAQTTTGCKNLGVTQWAEKAARLTE